MNLLRSCLLLLASAAAWGSDTLTLRPHATVSSAGVFLDDLVSSTDLAIPHVRILPPPRLGASMAVSRQQIESALAANELGHLTNLPGPASVRVTRKLRPLDPIEVVDRITAVLQDEVIKSRGQLELRLNRPWTTTEVPDEPLQARVYDLPASGLSSTFICRLELITTNQEVIGPWQVSLGAKLWRDVWTSPTPLRRGIALIDADLQRERRDILAIREPVADFEVADPSLELGEYVAPQGILLARSLRVRPSVRRGQRIEALVVDGALAISLKVEALEDGIPGQTIRLRNPHTKRELFGTIQNESTILIQL